MNLFYFFISKFAENIDLLRISKLFVIFFDSFFIALTVS